MVIMGAVTPHERARMADSFSQDVYTVVQSLDSFVAANCTTDGQQCVLIFHKKLFNHPPFGATSRCRIAITGHCFVVNVLMKEVERGHVATTDDVIKLCEKYSPYSATHKFCPGLGVDQYEKYKETIRFDVKSLRQTTEPFHRIESASCSLWFDIGKRPSAMRRESESLLCHSCIRLKCNLDRQVTRTEGESPSKKLKRQNPSSNAPLTYMSPKSQQRRKQRQKLRHDDNQRRLRRYEHTEIPLDEEQHSEMTQIINEIEEHLPNELEKLIAEGKSNVIILYDIIVLF